MGRVASFHLVREPAWKSPLALARLGTDRVRVSRIEGLVFWRLLGTGRGNRTAPGVQWSRTALFAVWEDESHLERFLGTHPVARRWALAAEAWHVRLRRLGGHGSWKGFDPLEGLDEGDAGGSVAIVTRAAVRRRAWRPFGAASTVVDTELHTATGLIDVVGIGETPVGNLATFSLWASLADARAFAYSMPQHRDAIRRTRTEDWYAEELFARFEPYGSHGSWDGRDPLAR